MKLGRYYLLTSLPSLGGLGTTPPLSFAELMEQVEDDRARRKLVGSLILMDDLQQREAQLAGELSEVDPAVLTIQQVRGETDLPDYLDPAADDALDTSRGFPSDWLWERYFRHVQAVAQELDNRFLQAWVRFEVGLRNALATVRAKRLDLEPADYLVAPDVSAAPESFDFDPVLGEWAAAATPLAGHRVLLRARWDWLEEQDAYFTFRDDELAAYAARLLLLHHWRRAMSAEDESASAT